MFAITAKAMHDTYAQLLSGNEPEELQPILATPETNARLLMAANHEQWCKTYLNQD